MSDEDQQVQEQDEGQLKALTRDDLFSFEGKRVEIERLNGYLYVQPLPFEIARKIMKESRAGEADEEAANINVEEHIDDFLIYGVVDADGERVFEEEDRGRFDEDLPFDVGMNLAMEVMGVSGLTEDAEEEIQGN